MSSASTAGARAGTAAAGERGPGADAARPQAAPTIIEQSKSKIDVLTDVYLALREKAGCYRLMPVSCLTSPMPSLTWPLA